MNANVGGFLRNAGFATVVGALVVSVGSTPASAAPDGVAAGKISFAAAVVSDLGPDADRWGPTDIGDFDGDGAVDLVHGIGTSIALSSGSTDGSFVPASTIRIGRSVEGVDVVDLNGDTDPDLVVISRTGHRVYTLIGQPGLAFSKPREAEVAGRPIAPQYADLDGDGDLDMALGHDSVKELTVLENDGDGALSVASTYGDLAGEIVVADLDGDGVLDLLISNRIPGIVVKYGSGDLTFGSAVVVDDAHYNTGLAAVDANGDGLLDVARWSMRSQTVKITLNNGDRTFTEAAPVVLQKAPMYQPFFMDFDEDGVIDVGAFGGSDDGSTIFAMRHGKGDATFGKLRTTAIGSGHTSPVVADFDDDGLLDIAVTGTDGHVAVARGAAKKFKPAKSWAASASSGQLHVADLNGDRRLDIVAVTPDPSVAAALLNTSK